MFSLWAGRNSAKKILVGELQSDSSVGRGIAMSSITKQMMQEALTNEVSHMKQAPRGSCCTSSWSGTGRAGAFKVLSIFLNYAVSTSRFHQPTKAKRRVLMPRMMGEGRTLSGIGAMIIAMLCFLISGSLTAAPTLHEQLLASDPILSEADAVHSAAYRRLRSSLDKDNQQQLKAAQIRWIDSLNQTLAQTQPFQRGQVALQWTQERTRNLNGIHELRNGRAENANIPQNANIPELPKPFSQPNNILREIPDEAQQKEARTTAVVAALTTDIAKHWKTEDDASDLPECLPNALVDRLEQLVPWSKIDHSGVAKGRYANLILAYAIHNAITTKPLNLSTMADLLEKGKDLNLEDVPWVGSFRRILETRRTKALSLQEEALGLMKDGDSQAAEARMEQAAKEYSSTSLSAYSVALGFYNKLAQDKALRAVDGDWKKPSLPDKDLFSVTSKQAAALRTFEGKEVSAALSSIAKGYDAAYILWKFSSDYEPAGDLDQPHPIRALQAMRKSEKYRDLKSNESFFTKPFVDRIKFLEELIGPKTTDYEKLAEQAAGLEREGKYLDAATAYRLALGIEYSKELEQTIHRCEAKTSGL